MTFEQTDLQKDLEYTSNRLYHATRNLNNSIKLGAQQCIINAWRAEVSNWTITHNNVLNKLTTKTQ